MAVSIKRILAVLCFAPLRCVLQCLPIIDLFFSPQIFWRQIINLHQFASICVSQIKQWLRQANQRSGKKRNRDRNEKKNTKREWKRSVERDRRRIRKGEGTRERNSKRNKKCEWDWMQQLIITPSTCPDGDTVWMLLHDDDGIRSWAWLIMETHHLTCTTSIYLPLCLFTSLFVCVSDCPSVCERVCCARWYEIKCEDWPFEIWYDLIWSSACDGCNTMLVLPNSATLYDVFGTPHSISSPALSLPFFSLS